MSKTSPAAAFKPAAPTIIMPGAKDVAEFAPPRRGRQTPAAARKGRVLPGIRFTTGLGDEHRKRHLALLGRLLPQPTGYNLNVVMFVPPEKSAGGIDLTGGGSLGEYRYQGKVGLVVGVGPDAYQDKAKFPTGPWCKLHDWVIFPAYLDSSRKFTWYGEGGMVDIIVMHDDKIDAVIDDPVLVT